MSLKTFKCFLLSLPYILASEISIYPKPNEVPSSSAYSLKVRPYGNATNATGSGWEPVPLYQAQVMETDEKTGISERHNTTVAYFDFNGSVEISVTPQHVNHTKSVRVRPLSHNITPSFSDNEILFKLADSQRDAVVEVNGDVFGTLQIWTNPVEPEKITKDDAIKDDNIIYFGAGYHSLENCYLNLSSDQTLYLEGGAVLEGGIRMANATGVKVLGRGILYHSQDNAVTIDYSSNVQIEGVAVINPGHYNLIAGSSRDVTVRYFRGISAVGWGDGIDLFCMEDVLIERVFLRTSDDCIALYQHRWGYLGDSRNITIRDASLWADVAHPIHLGLHGNTVDPEKMSDVTLRNIDILDQREPQIDYQGCIAINAGDDNMIENILFDDIRVEDFRLGSLFRFNVIYNSKYNSAPGRAIRNVTIKDLSYSGQGGTTSIMQGYSPSQGIEFVRFENLRINGEHIYDGMEKPAWYLTTDFVPMLWGTNVKNVTFI